MSSADLPDVNVWIAMVDETHVHHPAARHYWNEQAAPKIVFSRVTMLGLLRLSTSAKVLTKPLSYQEAWDTYYRFLSLPEVRFEPEPPDIEDYLSSLTLNSILPHRLWTDAWHAAFALASGCRLVSFDSDFHHFPGLDFLHLIP